jgi:hypothetical protein
MLRKLFVICLFCLFEIHGDNISSLHQVIEFSFENSTYDESSVGASCISAMASNFGFYEIDQTIDLIKANDNYYKSLSKSLVFEELSMMMLLKNLYQRKISAKDCEILYNKIVQESEDLVNFTSLVGTTYGVNFDNSLSERQLYLESSKLVKDKKIENAPKSFSLLMTPHTSCKLAVETDLYGLYSRLLVLRGVYRPYIKKAIEVYSESSESLADSENFIALMKTKLIIAIENPYSGKSDKYVILSLLKRDFDFYSNL